MYPSLYPEQVYHGNSLDDMEKIHEPGRNLVVIHRANSSNFHALMTNIKEKKIQFDIDQEVDVENATNSIREVLRSNGIDGSRWLLDIQTLCKHMGGLERTRKLRLKLHTLTKDECKLFHVDYVCLRMLCTFFGPPTQWIANQDVDRTQFGTPWTSFDEMNDRILKGPPTIRYLPLGAVALLKGENYPGNQGNGLVHRSCPVEKSGLTRIRLCIDAAHKHEENKEEGYFKSE